MSISRNDPCPCGSGKKFKKCHMGREEELVLEKMDQLPEDLAEKIRGLAEVNHGGCRDLVSGLNLEALTGSSVGFKFVDLGAYLDLGVARRPASQDLNRVSAGQMINPIKTLQADPDKIYIAVSPAVSPSTLVHQLAHALDYLAGSRLNPALASALSQELEVPLELVEHPQEFGKWLTFLANELQIELDAEDSIVAFLYEEGRLVPGQAIQDGQNALLEGIVKATMDFIRSHRKEIDERIRNRQGYMPDQAPSAQAPGAGDN